MKIARIVKTATNAGTRGSKIEPDQIFRIFAAFKEIGIEVTDGEKDFEEVEQIDDEMLLDIEMSPSTTRCACT